MLGVTCEDFGHCTKTLAFYSSLHWTAGVTLASSFPSRPLGALCNVLLTYGGSFAVFLEGLSHQFEQVIHVGWGIRLKIGLRSLLTGP